MAAIVCQFCPKGKAVYTCPRCNAPYCELKCYQSEPHRQCSESFYKDCIETEIASNSAADASTKLKTLELLKKDFYDSAKDEDELDSDDDEDLGFRLEGIDLDDTDKVWSLLSPEERRDFQRQIESGEIYKIVPKEHQTQDLWWDVFYPKKKIAEVDAQSEGNLHQHLPSIFTPEKIVDTYSCSPLIKHNLVNIILSYAFGYKYLVWHEKPSPTKEDYDEFSKLILTLSTNLKKAENFSSFDHAIESVISMAMNSSLKAYTNDIRATKHDVMKIIRGPGECYEDKLYVHAALSDLRRILHRHVTACKKNSAFTKKELLLSIKKVEFYICWIMNNYEQFRSID